MTAFQDRFAGKTAIVTGAGSGIGLATALRMAEEGAKVVAADISAERLEQLAADHAELGIVTVAGDIAAEDAPAKLLEAAGGQVDILVNNAGIMDGFLPAGEVDDATVARVLDINVGSMVRLIRAVLPGMQERKAGSIVNVSSEASLRGSISGVAYAASKHAVVGVTENTAAVYRADGIRCNAVAPGAVKTNIEAPMNSQLAATRLGPTMQGTIPGMGEPEQLAAAICFLASDEAGFISGVNLPVDGGWSVI